MSLSELPPEVSQQLPDWKLQYGELIYIPYSDPPAFVFRSITLNEWSRIKLCLELDDPLLTDRIAGEILQACLLWPKDYDLDFLSTGDFKRLYAQVSDSSPFGSLKNFAKALERYRDKNQDLANLIYAFTSAAFPGISRERVGEFTSHQVMLHLVTAETILQRTFEVPGTGRREAPTPPSPDEVKAMRAQRALQRREAAINRAQSRRQHAMEQRAEEMGYPDDPTPMQQPGIDPAMLSSPVQAPPSMSTPRSSSGASRAIVGAHGFSSDADLVSAGLTRVGGGGPLRRGFTSDEILEQDDKPIDFPYEKREIKKVWDEPEDPAMGDQPIVFGPGA